MANTKPMNIQNRYELIEELGKGAMGIVFRARDRMTNQIVALKQVFYEKITDPQMQHSLHLMLAQEFQTLASIRHPHIISVLDYGFQETTHPYFTMDFLADPITIVEAAAQVDTPVKIELLLQAFQAVAYLHRRGILHRDLKPANVMVDQWGMVKVLDFGLAVDANQRSAIAGTPAYMAPEIFYGNPPTRQTDLFALGIIAFQMLTGDYPFPRGEGNIMDAILSVTPDYARLPIMQSHLQSISLDDVMHRLLAKSTHQRYERAEDAIADLSLLLGQPIPEENTAIRESFLQAARFVGRKQEMHLLEDALLRMRQDSGSAWLIGGESGVGKSRLLHELRTRALVQGAVVLYGTAQEGKELAMEVWLEALRYLIVAVPPAPEAASLLKNLIPDLEVLMDMPIPDMPPLPPAAYEQALSDLIVALFRRYKQPLLMLLDDAQWLDRADMLPLQPLIQMINGLPLLLVITYRDDERPDLPDELPPMRRIDLQRLNEAEIIELSQSMIGEAAQQSNIVELLQKETEGNAFFLVEVVRALAEEAGNLQNIPDVTLPPAVFAGGIQRLIERRLSQVPPWAYDALQLTAVGGRELDLNVLNHILAPILGLIKGQEVSVSISSIWRGRRGVTLDDWLLVCADAAILEVYNNRWRFTHDKLREYILDQMPRARYRILNSQIAQAIERLYPVTTSLAIRLEDLWLNADQPDKADVYTQFRDGEDAV